MNITNKNSLEQALKTGFNLFVGAGFSILAQDKNGRTLPLGNELRDELAERFSKAKTYSLPQLSTIIQATNRQELYSYLIERFNVGTYDTLYKNINNLNIKSVFTTNIDNLIPKIIKDGGLKYVNNQYLNGPAESSQAINYMPLHGYVDMEPQNYIFDVASIANIYNDAPRLWSFLAREIEARPTVFLGYGYNDSSVIQALTSHQTFQNARKEMWMLLRNEDVQYREYFELSGFSIIEGDIKEFLTYIKEFTQKDIEHKHVDKERLDLLQPDIVPHSIQDVNVQRPIKDFYLGSSPEWCDIINNQIYKTHYFNIINNLVYDKLKHVIIIGAPVCGKSTLLMQVAFLINHHGQKLFFKSISKERAEFLTKIIGDENVIVFIDNVADNIDALHVFENAPTIKIVAAERSHNFSIISHLVDDEKYNVINVTQLTNQDLQGIYNALPSTIRGEYLKIENELSLYGKDSIFEFVIRNVDYPNIRDRYKEAIRKLEMEDEVLAEFIILCAYMHNCHVPLSFETAYDYFLGLYEDVDYKDIFELKKDADDIIKDYLPIDNGKKYADMDYYYPRSRYAAEVIINTCSSNILCSVLTNLVNNVGSYRICDYSIFRKYAFDKSIVLKAFPNWVDGKEFYEKAFVYDRNNPYVLQQGALYLAQKQQFDYAFEWIDRALNMTDDKYFSIRNTHAIILFNANIYRKDLNARAELDTSMRILEKCMKADKRKRFHAITFGKQAIQYFERYQDEVSISYMQQAKEWLSSEINHSAWDIEVKQVLETVSQYI